MMGRAVVWRRDSSKRNIVGVGIAHIVGSGGKLATFGELATFGKLATFGELATSLDKRPCFTFDLSGWLVLNKESIHGSP